MQINRLSKTLELCIPFFIVITCFTSRINRSNVIFCDGFQTLSYKSLPYRRHGSNHQSSLLSVNYSTKFEWIDNGKRLIASRNRQHAIFMIPNDTQNMEYKSWPFALILLSQFVLFVGVGAIIPAIPLYGQSIGLSQAANGVVVSAPAIMLLTCARWGGNFSDQARKPAMMIGMSLIVLSDIGTSFATTLPLLILARLGLGAGRCIAESGERGMIADIAGRIPSLRGRALAAQQAITALGISIGAPIGGLVIESYGPRASFLCVSAGALVSLFMYSFLPETVPLNADTNRLKHGSSGHVAAKADWSILLKDRKWQGLAICQSGATFGFAAKIACIPLLATATLPGGAVGTGALLSLAGLSGIVGAPFGGWLTDKVGARFTVVFSGCVSAIGLIFIPCVLNGIGYDYAGVDLIIPFLGGNFNGSEAGFVCAVLSWSLGAASQGPALTALAQELAPLGEEATALAFPRAAGDSTYIFAPFILGTIADKTSMTAGLGLECAFAGIAGLLGILAFLSSSDDKISF